MRTKKREIEEVFTADINKMELHYLVDTHRKMSNSEYQSLKMSIDELGQINPVTVFKGKIVDGRHRYLILNELGISTIKYVKLKNNLTLNAVKDIIMGTEVRRVDTSSQRALKAYWWLLDNPGATQADAGIKFNVRQEQISRAKSVEKALGSDFTKKFYKDGSAMIGNKRYNTLQSILQAIKISRETNIPEELDDNLKDLAAKLNNIMERYVLESDYLSVGFAMSHMTKIHNRLKTK